MYGNWDEWDWQWESEKEKHKQTKERTDMDNIKGSVEGWAASKFKEKRDFSYMIQKSGVSGTKGSENVKKKCSAVLLTFQQI